MLRTRTLLAALICAVVSTVAVTAQQADQAYLGTWKLNLAKSTFTPGPGPKELTRIHENAGNGQIRVTTKTVGPNGNAGTTVYTYRPDGKDNPITGGTPAGPTQIAITRVDDYSVTYAQKFADGRPGASGRRVVAKDGKTMTITSTATNAQGQTATSIAESRLVP